LFDKPSGNTVLPASGFHLQKVFNPAGRSKSGPPVFLVSFLVSR